MKRTVQREDLPLLFQEAQFCTTMFQQLSKGFNRLRTLISILFVTPGIVAAQIGLTSVSPDILASKDWKMLLTYNQDNNIYFWRGAISVNKPLGRGYLLLQNNFDTNRIKLLSRQDKWKDSNQLYGQYVFPVKDNITSVFIVRSQYLSDLQSGFLNNISENALFVRLPVNTPFSISFTPLAGYTWDNRIGSTDQGLQYGLDIAMDETSAGEYSADAQFHYLSEKLNVRRMNNMQASVRLHRTFYQDTADTLRYTNSTQRRDYYISTAGNLETRKEVVHNVSNVLTYGIFDRSKMRIKTEYSAAEVDFSALDAIDGSANRSRRNRAVIVDITMDLKRANNNNTVTFLYENGQQRSVSVTGGEVFGAVPFDIPDNDRTKIAFGLSADGTFFRNQWYSFQGYIEKYQYDTPAEDKFDDHDRFRFLFKGSYRFKINPRLSLTFNSLASLDHLVYIFGQQSADNNWNRVFQASSLVEYSASSGLQITGDFNVLANYVDYDFKEEFIQVRSFVFRKFSMNQVIRIPVTRKGIIESHFQLNLEENGLLRWEQFLQNILIDRSIFSGTMKYVYQITPPLKFVPGISFFVRSETHHQTRAVHEVQKRLSEITDTGVSLEIVYRVNPSSLIRLNSSKRFVNRGIRQGGKKSFQYIDLSVNWLF